MSTSIKDTAKKLAIHHIYISNSTSALHNNFDPLAPNQILSGQFKIETVRADVKTVSDDEVNITHRFLRFFVQGGMRYILGAPTEDELKDEEWVKSKLVSEITAMYCVEYAINSDLELSPEVMTEFGSVNAPCHVWPFWREYIQSACNRMNLPVTTVPMLIIDPIEKNEESK